MSEEDPAEVLCPRCEGRNFRQIRDGYADVGTVIATADGTYYFNELDADYGYITHYECNTDDCDFAVASGDWDTFIEKITMPDPSALLALRDRLNP